MGFDAGQAVEPLDYNFTRYGGGQGTTPEPDEGAIDKMFIRLREKVAELKDVDPDELGDESALLDQLADFPEDVVSRQLVVLRDIVHEVAQGIPSRDDIAKLPFRPQMAYFGWFLEKFRPGV